MKAFIYCGGGITAENITERPREGDLVIAADSGYLSAKALGVTPDILLGDFDSLGKENIPEGIKVMEVPAEKDFTDTQLAADTAIKSGAEEIIIIGGLDGRLDHTLSNLAILEDMWQKNIFCTIASGSNRVRYIENSSTLIPRSGYKYLSVIAISEKLRGVEIKGCKYPLEGAVIHKNFQYAVSNEITGNCAFISVKKGKAYIVESN